MATKAQLQAELSKLGAELERMRAERTQAKETERAEVAAPAGTLAHDLLARAGLETDMLEDAGAQLLDEVSALQKDHPMLVLLGAFALGLMIGRAIR